MLSLVENFFSQGIFDPEYIILWDCQFKKDFLQRWLLAYWCFSHAGIASWIAETDLDSNYFRRMLEAAKNSKIFPRGVARRYFVGKYAVRAIEMLSDKGVKGSIGKLCNHYFWYLPDFMDEVCSWYKFGPWAAFKAADMLERLDLIGLNSDGCARYMLDAPKQGAQDLWNHKYPDLSFSESQFAKKDVEGWAVDWLLVGPLGSYKAPPRYERCLNLQEAETILCKYHAHIRTKRTYNVGDDIRALRKELGWRWTETASKLVTAGKKRELWNG